MSQPFKPLSGVKIVEIASIGPGPFCAMMLADHGADIIRIEKPGGRDVGTSHFEKDPLLRGRHKLKLDLKNPDDAAKAMHLISKADGLIEGFRPGVMERLGLGPDECLVRNPALIYGRMTGWGQSGPRAQQAGHDINYIALTGALDTVGTPESGPVPALNLIGDFGGGGMLLAFGMVSALLSAKATGEGTVVDAAMVDGAALLMTMTYGLQAQGLWNGGRGDNILDGGSPFYGTYETADGEWMAVGAIEEPFWQKFIALLELKSPLLEKRYDKAVWADLRNAIAERFASQTKANWEQVFDGSDACVAAVRSMADAPHDPHLSYRKVLQESDGVMQPAPAPRYGGQTPETPKTDTSTVDYKGLLEKWS